MEQSDCEDLGMECVSVIIPVYNAESYLEECLDSVCSQTHVELEIIIIDDGSNDKSLEICRSYEDKDKRIKVLSHKNQGVSFTRNRGIREAHGKYLMFVDADDMIAPTFIEHYVQEAEKSGADVIIGEIVFLMENGEEKKKTLPQYGDFDEDIWNVICEDSTGVFGYVANKLYRRELLDRFKVYFDESIYAQEDLDFAISAYGCCMSFRLIEERGYIYRYRPGKRKHPLVQYMKNQLKLLQQARNHSVLEVMAEESVIRRVLNILYSFLYYLPIDEEFENNCKQLKELTGLSECMNFHVNNIEINMICKLVQRNRYGLLKTYFKYRHMLRYFIRGK